MGKFLKKHAHITTIVSVVLFLLFHFYLYRQVEFLEDHGTLEIPVLHNWVDSPLIIGKLSLCEKYEPSYYNPFRKVKYVYQEKIVDETGDSTYGECNLVEIQKNYFSHKMEQMGWDVEDFWLGYEREGFTRELVENEYSTMLYFLIQYSLLYLFIFYLRK